MTKMRGRARVDEHPDLVGPVRDRLRATGLPYVIENVPGAPLVDPVLVCGGAMGRRYGPFVLKRHRLFESNVDLRGSGCECKRGHDKVLGVYGGGTRQTTRPDTYKGGTTDKANREQGRALMGMPWASRKELTQAIPPAYTEFLGLQLLYAMNHPEAACAA